VLARFIVWEGENVLLVPTSALFRSERGWAVFSVEGGAAVRKSVRIGHQTGLMAEVLSGLDDGDEVIIHPANSIEEGTRVEPLRD
jgi:HlyD family secretion protein